MTKRIVAILVAGLMSGTAAAQHSADAPGEAKPVTLLAGIGSHRHPIATSSSGSRSSDSR